ncbi:ABC transporter permease [Allosphingosinicella indica]|uniref:Putative ABC transport system permease protein n=1 Tax=Allosphingosinicella indica TaxID=941907 RepID=A0A1X7G8T4_9SPHN|nr:ABC transporter permease [Allosphingosinicella indica]SMF66012.1 putative ABC transport system permease protein [Allosphingosinicella indica]
MWRNYLTVGIRALLKNRTYAVVNIAGLALGIAACLLLILYIRYETGYDRWLPDAERTYQVQSFSTDRETGDEYKLRMSQYVAGTTLQKDFPQIEARVHASGTSPVVLSGGEALEVEDAIRVDGPFFDIVRLPFVAGDPLRALSEVNSAVLSETEARRLFGNESALGKTLTLIERGERVDYRVTGVMRDIPKNSHLNFTMVIRSDFNRIFADYPGYMTSWGEISGWNYVRLRPGADVEAIRAGLPAWEKRNIPDQAFGDRMENPGTDQDWKLVNVRDVHLGAADRAVMRPGNDRATIITFAVVAALILAMACINFTNLATARASQRAREVALRKVLGASRGQLIVQFLGESMLVALLATIVGLSIAELMLPVLAAFLDADLQLHYLGSDGVLLPVVCLTLIVGAAGGLYPAFFLSRFQPAQVLRANKSAAETPGSGRLRNALVVAQFAVSNGLIICTAIVYAQTVHARTADPGFDREGVLQLETGYRGLIPQLDSLAKEIARIDGVRSVAKTSIGVSTSSTMGRGVRVPGRSDVISSGNYPVDENFFTTMGVRLIAGRNFDAARPMDETSLPYPTPNPVAERAIVERGGNVIVNQLAARRLGFANPADAVGKEVRVAVSLDPTMPMMPVTIVGVVQDSRFRSIRIPLEPMMYRLAREYNNYIVVRYDSADPESVRRRIGELWKRFAPDLPYQARFGDEINAELYDAEEARAKTFAGFAILAIAVACLGLFGLAAFTAERRTKEIGIRKVFGARVRDIVQLLAWQFSKPVIIANLIAWPVAWWVMRDWLNSFDARIALGPTPFLLAGALALFIAIATVSGHAIRVARANPIHALRYE